MTNIACPGCAQPIEPDFARCPWCGRHLAASCAHCFTLLQPGWGWCPRCGRPVGEPSHTLRQVDSESEAERHNQLGIAHYDAERFPEAVEEFLKAIALEPSNAIYHSNAAVAYQEAGDTERALFEFQKAIELDPEDTSSLLNLGFLHAALGHEQQAAQYWRVVMEKDGDGPDGDEARRALFANGKR